MSEDDRYRKAKKDYPGLSDSTWRSLAIHDEDVINYDLLVATVEYICDTCDDGAILVFMTGMMEITTLYEQMMEYGRPFSDESQYRVYPLHSSLSTAEQKAIFDVPPAGVRKVVIATNIAETSITIEDVVYVVDAGRVKENQYDNESQMPTLVETIVSKANAKQRRGRAGRVRPGMAFHMFESKRDLAEFQLPEILRVSLDELVLQVRTVSMGRAMLITYVPATCFALATHSAMRSLPRFPITTARV